MTVAGGKTEVNAPDKSVLMDEFTSATRERGSGRTPRQISVKRTEGTSTRVEREEEEGAVIGVKSFLLFPLNKKVKRRLVGGEERGTTLEGGRGGRMKRADEVKLK